MRRFLSALTLAYSFSAYGLAPKVVNAPVEAVLIPSGFDDNDHVQIILRGNFPNTCFRVGNVKHKIDHKKKEVTIKAFAYDYSENMTCNEVLVPFIQEVNVGLLKQGSYTVKAETKTAPLAKTVSIAQATTSSPDSHLYAPISSAFIEKKHVDGETLQQITLVGSFPNMLEGCMIIDEIRIKENPTSLLEVLPIAHIVKDDRCVNQPTQFKVTQTIENVFSGDHGEGVLHVRSFNGKAINSYVKI